MFYQELSRLLKTPETCILYACKLLKRNYMTELFILYACKLLKNNSMTALFILYACNSITELFIGISKIFKKPLGNLVRSFFLVALQPACCKPATLFKISSRATTRNIECTREKLQNAEASPVALLMLIPLQSLSQQF